MSVTFPDGKKAIRFKDWDKKYQQIFIDRGPFVGYVFSEYHTVFTLQTSFVDLGKE
jgi:hypothetical protein